jgi:hypothetical protein
VKWDLIFCLICLACLGIDILTGAPLWIKIFALFAWGVTTLSLIASLDKGKQE